jgi:hypothetical protein
MVWMGLFRKLGFTLLLLVAVFLISYLVAFFVISLTPYGNVTERVYSTPQTPASYDPSSIGGAWENQLLYLIPGAGSTNVPRDTAIWIDEPRSVRVENLSLSPEVPIVRTNEYYSSPPSAVITVYPAELLQPNTTYNVSAIVGGTPSWWIFTTSSEPSQPTFSTHLAPYDTWVAFTAAILATMTVMLAFLLQRRKHTRIVGNLVTNAAKATSWALFFHYFKCRSNLHCFL